MNLWITFLLALLAAYALNRLFIRLSKRLGSLSDSTKKGEKGELRWASSSKPLVGGITFFVLFLAGTALILALLPSAAGALPRGLLALLLASAVAFGVGLADDLYNTRPLLKLGGQIVCGLLLLAFGVRIEFSGIWAFDGALTLLWVVGIMNSFNLIDNMDGVSGSFSLGVLCTTVLALVLAGVTTGFYFYLAVFMLGANAGFLILNWKPSKLFMGDTGSQFLGLLLAYLGIVFFWNSGLGTTSPLRSVLVVALVFFATLLDTAFVTVARIRRGQSPMKGGKDHISHHLVYLGLHERYVPVVFGTVTLVSGAIALTCRFFVADWTWLHTGFVLAYLSAMVLLFAYLYTKGLDHHQRRQAEQAQPLPATKPSVGAVPPVVSAA